MGIQVFISCSAKSLQISTTKCCLPRSFANGARMYMYCILALRQESVIVIGLQRHSRPVEIKL